jgi:hypothetical protein
VLAALSPDERPVVVGALGGKLGLDCVVYAHPPHDVPHARSLAAIARSANATPIALVEPEYVRPAEITAPKR